MKYYLILFLVLTISCSSPDKDFSEDKDSTNTTVQNEKPLASDSPQVSEELHTPNNQKADPIANIRKNVSLINTTQIVKKHFEYVCDEKTMLDYFYQDGEIKKISIDFGAVGDVYAKEDYYYEDGKLIFIYEYVNLLMPCGGCDQTQEFRSYIHENKVIRYLKDKNEDKCNDCTFSASSKEYQLLKAKTAEDMKVIICR